MRDKKGRFIKGHIPWTKIHGHSKESKEKMSKYRKGKPAWNKGVPCSEETKRKLSEYNIGKTIPENIREKISKSMKGKNSCEKNPNWKGGKFTNKNGIVFIYNPYHPFCNKVGYVMEHRLVMEKALKRFLTKDEVVHHIDNNKSNNSSNNLVLFKSSEHVKFHHILLKECQ